MADTTKLELVAQLRAHSVEAVAVLRRIAADNDSPAAVRVSASRAILEFLTFFEDGGETK